MIDIFACAKSLHCQVRNCRTIAEGVDCDHTAVRLDLVLTSLKQTDSTALFMQSVGVQQGDNMAPVLFLFLMSAAAETLEPAWRQANIEVLTVAHTPDEEIDTGCVRGHTPCMYTSRKLTAYEIYQLLYVDDGRGDNHKKITS